MPMWLLSLIAPDSTITNSFWSRLYLRIQCTNAPTQVAISTLNQQKIKTVPQDGSRETCHQESKANR